MTTFSARVRRCSKHGPLVSALILAMTVDHPFLTLQNDVQGPELRPLFGTNAYAETDLLPPPQFGRTQLHSGLAQFPSAQPTPEAF